MIVLLSIASLASLSAQVEAVPANADRQVIIVTGQRLRNYRDALARCLARNCPPDEDIAASTALAEVLFISGDYRAARSVLRASVGRNKRKAGRYPEPVSNLYRADARIARHLGLDREAQDSTRQVLGSLKTGIPVEDTRHLTARLEMAHSLVFFRKYGEAERNLRELAEMALRAGYKDMATVAELQSIWVLYKRGFWEPARKELLTAANAPDPQRSIGAKILLIRMYGERGDRRRADAIIKQLGRGGQKRALLFEPEYLLPQYETVMDTTKRVQSLATNHSPDRANPNITINNSMASLADRLTDNFEDAWVDVSYRVQPDGTVDDVQVIRRGPGAVGWEEPLLKSVSGRRYTASTDNRQTQKIERFSYTAPMWNGAGSRINSRSLRARVEKIELSSVDVPAGPA